MSIAKLRSEALLLRACDGKYGPLLVSLLGLCLFAPALTGGPLKGGLLDAVMSIIVLTGIYAASPTRGSLVLGMSLAVITLSAHRLVTVFHYEPLHAFHYFVTLAILLYAARTILAAVIRDRMVTIETIKGAVCVYLLIGLAWVYIFVLADMFFPGSFRIPLSPEGMADGHLLVRRELPRLLYFSFATLTTVGYGDIVPLRGFAQTACYLEAVLGQIYLTVLVARLVGMHISHTPRADEAGTSASADRLPPIDRDSSERGLR